jgi:hypothetical protein
MNRRAQTSVEWLLALAVSMIILAFLIQSVTNQTGNLQKDFAIKQAQQSMSDLVKEINTIYSQGPGSQTQASVIWPGGIDANASSVSGHSIILNVYQTDIVGEVIPPISGGIPTAPGKHSVLVSVAEGGVVLGTLLLESDTASLYQPIARDSNQTASIVLTNKSSEDAAFTASLTWDHSLVDVNVSPVSGSILAGQTQTITFDIASTASALGNYVGNLSIEGTFPSQTQLVSIPVNVEVFTGSGLMNAFPGTLSYNLFANDSNGLDLQICNISDSSIKSVSFSPSSGDAGDWVQGISTIDSIEAQTCETATVTVNVPPDTGIGTYQGNLVVLDFTGVNNVIVPFDVFVKGMSDIFSWDWTTATFAEDNIDGHTLENTGNKMISISELTISKWWSCDTEHSNLTSVTMDGNVVFSGEKMDGNVLDVADFNISSGSSITNNTIGFDNNISDDGEQFLAVVTFSDSSTYTSSTAGDGCPPDTVSPENVTDLDAEKGTAWKSIEVTWTYPGDDGLNGTATNAVFKRDTSPITTIEEFNNADTVDFSGPYLEGGSSGSLTDTGLVLGTTYYYAVIFWDEADNNSGLSNTDGSVPQNNVGGGGGGRI